jgi:2-iminoacetate synthase
MLDFFKDLLQSKAINCTSLYSECFDLIKANDYLKRIIKRCRNNLNELYIIVPHYQTSYCSDDCTYCGFKKSNKGLIRHRLDEVEFIKELNLLFDWGYRCIELVYATDPNIKAEDIARRIELAYKVAQTRNINISIGLNANVFSEREYKVLYNSGLDFFVLWMETYNENNYKRWHKKGTPKYDYKYRLEAYDRAISAGIEKYGMGILLGLSPWKEDVLSLFKHAISLEEKYGISPYIFGVPRIKQSMSFDSEKIVTNISNLEYSFILNLYRSMFPNTKLFLNTREEYEVNKELIFTGGDLFTIDCATFPGAYLKQEYIINKQMQFKTDYYDRKRVSKDLEKNGYELVYEW